VTRLADPGYESWAGTASLETRIVAYADKRAGQRLEPMDERFASWRRRYPTGPGQHVAGGASAAGAGAAAATGAGAPAGAAAPAGGPTGSGWTDDVAALVELRAAELERVVCAAAGVDPSEVRRLRWSRRALREAAA
jgi:hypothetical protein